VGSRLWYGAWGLGVLGQGMLVKGLTFGVWGSGFGVLGPALRVQRLGFGTQGARFRG